MIAAHFVITQGQYTILAAIVAGVAALLVAQRKVGKTVNTIEVNTNRRLSEALETIKRQDETITGLRGDLRELIGELRATRQAPAMDKEHEGPAS